MAKKHVRSLAGFQPVHYSCCTLQLLYATAAVRYSCCTLQLLYATAAVRYSCCINSCVCFVGPYKGLIDCPNCKEAQLKANGKPRKYYDYIPVIPRLQAMLANSIHAEKMRY
jgi:hypothetical protein